MSSTASKWPRETFSPDALRYEDRKTPHEQGGAAIERTQDLSPGAILDAVEGFRGSVIDLDQGQIVRGAEIARASYELANFMRTEGAAPGDLVLMPIGNGPMFPATLAAVLQLGGSPVLLHADTPSPEIVRNGQSYGARLVVADALRKEDLEAAGFACKTFSFAPWATGIWARAVAGTMNGKDHRLAGSPLHPTSGTTGAPKLAIRPGFCATEEARHYIATIGIDRHDLVFCTIPMSHGYGYGMCLMVPLLSGASVVTMRRFNSQAILTALTEQPITVYPATPAVLDLLLFVMQDSRPPLPRCITSAGAPLPERLAHRVMERWGAIVRPLYGTTETGAISVGLADHRGVAGDVGPPMGCVSTEIRPEENEGGMGTERDIGHVWVRSSSIMAGYLGPNGIDRSAIVAGWYDTGDLARTDEAGHLILHGRAGEVINVFGMKVLPSEVEEVISLLPQVAEVKVYGAPNRWGSQSVKAAIVASKDLTPGVIRAHCRKHLVDYKQPEYIAMIDRLPRSPSGKIVLAELP